MKKILFSLVALGAVVGAGQLRPEKVETISKTYSHEEQKVSLRNQDNDLAFEAKLETAYSVMVPEGKDVKVAEIRLIDWDAKQDQMFDSMRAYSNKDGSVLSKQFTYKYVTEYIETASVDENDKITLHREPDWKTAVPFTSVDELPSKDILIGIFTDTIFGESVEWIPTIRGARVEEWADYDVTQIASLEHDISDGTDNSLVKIDDTHYILAYAGSGSDGFIKTFSIDGSYGNITQIDSLEHDIAQSVENSLVQIDSTHYILAYGGVDTAAGSTFDGFIKTFSIDGSYGNITQIDSLEHDTTQGEFNSLVKIDDTHFILAYSGSGDDGFIKTFSIDGSYDNITVVSSTEHDTVLGQYNSLVQIDSTHFILAYAGNSSDGFVKTFSIDGSYGNITQIDSLEHDIADGLYNSLVKIDSTHFILAYGGPDTGGGAILDGFLKTFSIDGSFDNITEINALEHDTTAGLDNSLVKIDSTHFILAYAGPDTAAGTTFDGIISTFSIDGSYSNITKVSSTEHDTTQGEFNSLVQIDLSHYMLAYSGAGNDGFIKTFLLAVPTPPPAGTSTPQATIIIWEE